MLLAAGTLKITGIKHKEQQRDFNKKFEKNWRASVIGRTVQLKLLLQLLGLLLTILNLDEEQRPSIPQQVLCGNVSACEGLIAH